MTPKRFIKSNAYNYQKKPVTPVSRKVIPESEEFIKYQVKNIFMNKYRSAFIILTGF